MIIMWYFFFLCLVYCTYNSYTEQMITRRARFQKSDLLGIIWHWLLLFLISSLIWSFSNVHCSHCLCTHFRSDQSKIFFSALILHTFFSPTMTVYKPYFQKLALISLPTGLSTHCNYKFNLKLFIWKFRNISNQ